MDPFVLETRLVNLKFSISTGNLHFIFILFYPYFCILMVTVQTLMRRRVLWCLIWSLQRSVLWDIMHNKWVSSMGYTQTYKNNIPRHQSQNVVSTSQQHYETTLLRRYVFAESPLTFQSHAMKMEIV